MYSPSSHNPDILAIFTAIMASTNSDDTKLTTTPYKHVATYTKNISYIHTHQQYTISIAETYKSLYFHKNSLSTNQFHRLVG
jgi:hypothetical protein